MGELFLSLKLRPIFLRNFPSETKRASKLRFHLDALYFLSEISVLPLSFRFQLLFQMPQGNRNEGQENLSSVESLLRVWREEGQGKGHYNNGEGK